MELALDGQLGGLRLCLDRIIPSRRQRAARLELPRVSGIADLGDTMAAITTAAMEGAITTGEAAELARGLRGEPDRPVWCRINVVRPSP